MDNTYYIYNIATDFSRTPSARNEQEGKNSGIKLRKIIAPLIKKSIQENLKFIINFDGGAGYGTSFLEEVFGGLIRYEHIEYKDLKKTLDFISNEEPDLIEECWEYIEDAHGHE